MQENILPLTVQDNTEKLRHCGHCIFICRENIMWFPWIFKPLEVLSLNPKQFLHVLLQIPF